MQHIPDGKYKLSDLTEFYGVSLSRLHTILCRGEFNKYVNLTKNGFSYPRRWVTINTESHSNLEFWIEKSLKRKQERLKRNEERNKGC